MCYNVDNCRSRGEDRATVCESSMASIDSPKWTSLRDLGMCLIGVRDRFVHYPFTLITLGVKPRRSPS
ncbi:hypothetical protein CsSME_00032610 [Camellia sinensis var. sinensis]